MSLVGYSLEGLVAVITLDRPPVNAISAELSADLDEVLTRAEAPEVRAVVVTGTPHFAAGADITGFRTAMGEGGRDALANRLADTIAHLERLPKPVIAAIRGYALGGGLELAMGCDFRFLSDDAQVGQPEIKLGLIPGAGGTQRLTRLVGLAKARDIVYSGRFVDAEEALAIGLADEVHAGDRLLPAALGAAEALADGPTVALAAAKAAINGGLGLPIDEAMALEAEQFQRSFATEDAAEGVAAFLEKRPPSFKGR